ncbi:MAG: ABC transporter permease subunit [Streptosporangiales bacterium]|nr:ABC transporter permease subunit [Streptosporangiales bacterium]
MTTVTADVVTPQVVRETERKDGWLRRAPLLPALIFAILVTQLPFLATIYYSTQSWNLVRPGSRQFVGLSNYAAVFADRTFRAAALNSIAITVGCVLAAMLFGIVLALLLDRPFRGRSVVRTLLITPFLVMPVATALLWKTSMFDPIFGVVNFVLSPFGVQEFSWATESPLLSVIVALVWQWTPFMMLLILAGLQSQSGEVLEAAAVDGASRWQTFVTITLPYLSGVPPVVRNDRGVQAGPVWLSCWLPSMALVAWPLAPPPCSDR